MWATFLTAVILPLLFFSSPCCCHKKHGHGHEHADIARFIEMPVLKGRFPYMCSIRYGKSRYHICSGFLVKSQWVVTAAHCIDPNDEPGGLNPIVYCGILEIDTNDKELIFSTNGIMHPKWTGNHRDGFDIALLKLDRETNLTLPDIEDVKPRLLSGEALTALGWGSTKSGGYTEILQMSNRLYHKSLASCNKFYEFPLKSHMICVDVFHENPCKGDSGGPLIIPDSLEGNVSIGTPELDFVVGVLSFGSPDCTAESPGVYTSIGHFADWIEDVTTGNLNTSEETDWNTLKSDDDLFAQPVESRHSLEEESVAPELSVEAQDVDLPDLSELSDVEVLEGLIAAIRRDDSWTVRYILEDGVDANSVYNNSDFYYGERNDSLLHWAARFDAKDSTKVLIEFGGDVEGTNETLAAPLHICGLYGSLSVARILVRNGTDVDAKDNNENTPLHYACYYGHLNVARFLVKKDADIEAKGDTRWTPLHLACKEGYLDIVKFLISQGADLTAVTDGGNTPLLWACHEGHLNVVKFLLKEGANIEARNKEEWTPLHEACEHGYLDVVKLLVKRGADLETQTYIGWRPLHLACEEGHLKIVEFLLHEGADIEAKTDYGWTPLSVACGNGRDEVAELLLESAADIDAVNNGGDTPLHVAARGGYIRVVEVLLDAGASTSAEGNSGKAPYDIICTYESADCNAKTKKRLKHLLS